MKHTIKIMLAVLVGIAITSTTAYAAPANPAIRAAASQLRLSLGSLHQKYVEDDSHDVVPTSYVDKEDGNIPAFAFDYSAVSPSGFYSKLHFLYAWGDTDYDGYAQSADGSITPYETDTSNKLFDTRGDFGYLIGIGTRVAIAPEIELGYTRWKREVQGSGYALGADETYDSYRYGLGLEVDVAATDKLVFMFEGVYGRQHTDISSDYLDESLGSNAYTRLAAGVDYRLTDRVHLGFRATRVHYEFDESDIGAYGFFEPSSETTQTRFMASVGWSLL